MTIPSDVSRKFLRICKNSDAIWKRSLFQISSNMRNEIKIWIWQKKLTSLTARVSIRKFTYCSNGKRWKSSNNFIDWSAVQMWQRQQWHRCNIIGLGVLKTFDRDNITKNCGLMDMGFIMQSSQKASKIKWVTKSSKSIIRDNREGQKRSRSTS